MAGIQELIRVENNNTLSFGNYLMDSKRKIQDFEVDGDMYKVKTYSAVTKLEKNGRLLYESTPGTTVHQLSVTEEKVTFEVEGEEDAQITVELEADQEYKVFIQGVQVGKMKTNLAGKIGFGVDFMSGNQKVEIKKA
ncbi:Endosialidase [Petrocella atlantisensis]|uniref:Endosialidase n=1 Tax=Petrocella atlantisensis TaxID=2173034 RepID=A0A3P7RUE9_9FIRM|nr:endosialidase [Petrocella atlantisensis]VDN46426.1 Endosialidase [Petrocella atlantisensis]